MEMQKGMLSQYIAPLGHPKMKIQSSVNHHYLNTGLFFTSRQKALIWLESLTVRPPWVWNHYTFWYYITRQNIGRKKNFNPTQLCRVDIPPSHSVSTSESLSISNCYFHQLVPATCHSHIKYGNNDNNFHYNQWALRALISELNANMESSLSVIFSVKTEEGRLT